MGLLGRAHGRLQQVLDGDLVPQRLVQETLAARQLAVGQDLDLDTREEQDGEEEEEEEEEEEVVRLKEWYNLHVVDR